MKAWTSEAGKLARYEHMGWRLWPQRRAWSFHSGSMARAGSALGSSRASWPAASGLVRLVWSGIPGLDWTCADLGIRAKGREA